MTPKRKKESSSRLLKFFILLPYSFLLLFTLKVTLELGYAAYYIKVGMEYLATVVDYEMIPCKRNLTFKFDNDNTCKVPVVLYLSENGNEQTIKGLVGFNSYIDEDTYPIGQEVRVLVVPVSTGEDILNYHSELKNAIEIDIAWLIFFLIMNFYVVFRLKRSGVKIELTSVAGKLTRKRY